MMQPAAVGGAGLLTKHPQLHRHMLSCLGSVLSSVVLQMLHDTVVCVLLWKPCLCVALLQAKVPYLTAPGPIVALLAKYNTHRLGFDIHKFWSVHGSSSAPVLTQCCLGCLVCLLRWTAW